MLYNDCFTNLIPGERLYHYTSTEGFHGILENKELWATQIRFTSSPYNAKRPVVCLDETCRQLSGEITPPLPARPGQIAVYDYAYVRNGVADLFMCFEPLAAHRFVKVTQTRTKIDFAPCLKDLSDTVYPDADTIVHRNRGYEPPMPGPENSLH